MKVEIKQGETVLLTLAGTDGQFTISYSSTALTVRADLPDTQGREGIIYCEQFGAANDAMDEPTQEYISREELSAFLNAVGIVYADISVSLRDLEGRADLRYHLCHLMRQRGVAGDRAEFLLSNPWSLIWSELYAVPE